MSAAAVDCSFVLLLAVDSVFVGAELKSAAACEGCVRSDWWPVYGGGDALRDGRALMVEEV